MKLFIIHGDYTIKSYERLQVYINSAKKRGWELIHLDSVTSSLREVLISQNLFTKERLIIIENVNKIAKKELVWFKKEATAIDATIVVYHPSTLSKTAINLFPKANKIEEFKFPKIIWGFLDSIYPGNASKSLELLHQTLENEPEEFVFAVIAKQIRDLYWIKAEGSKTPLPPWQLSKLSKQSQKFEEIELKSMINSLADADINAKTSRQNLRSSLDFIFATELQ